MIDAQLHEALLQLEDANVELPEDYMELPHHELVSLCLRTFVSLAWYYASMHYELTNARSRLREAHRIYGQKIGMRSVDVP